MLLSFHGSHRKPADDVPLEEKYQIILRLRSLVAYILQVTEFSLFSRYLSIVG